MEGKVVETKKPVQIGRAYCCFPKLNEFSGGKKSRQRPTLPPFRGSTIGAEELNCSVRNGKRWILLAIATDYSYIKVSTLNNIFMTS